MEEAQQHTNCTSARGDRAGSTSGDPARGMRPLAAGFVFARASRSPRTVRVQSEYLRRELDRLLEDSAHALSPESSSPPPRTACARLGFQPARAARSARPLGRERSGGATGRAKRPPPRSHTQPRARGAEKKRVKGRMPARRVSCFHAVALTLETGLLSRTRPRRICGKALLIYAIALRAQKGLRPTSRGDVAIAVALFFARDGLVSARSSPPDFSARVLLARACAAAAGRARLGAGRTAPRPRRRELARSSASTHSPCGRDRNIESRPPPRARVGADEGRRRATRQAGGCPASSSAHARATCARRILQVLASRGAHLKESKRPYPTARSPTRPRSSGRRDGPP